jgi:histidinol-phosphatase
MERHGRLEPFLGLARKCRASRTWCDAYGHALVATGRVEAMIEPVIKYWDIASLKLIVREAGGACTDMSGGQSPESEAISSNGLLHPMLLEAFRP